MLFSISRRCYGFLMSLIDRFFRAWARRDLARQAERDQRRRLADRRAARAQAARAEVVDTGAAVASATTIALLAATPPPCDPGGHC